MDIEIHMGLEQGPTAHELFEARVAAQPDSVALLYRDQSVSYAELNQRANRLAHLLIRRGIGPEIFAGIFLEPSIEAIVAILAILKSGGAYVALEPSQPPAALAAVIEQARLPLVLTRSNLAGRLPESSAESICLDHIAGELDHESAGNPKSAATCESPAFILFTSGSTGEPKGVVRLHRGIPIKLLWADFGPEEVYALNLPLSVAFAVHRIFQPLLGGAPLVLVPAETVTDIAQFCALLETHKVTNMAMVPAYLRTLLEAGERTLARLASVKTVTVAGSRLQPELIRRFAALLPGITLINHYAASEMGPCLLGVVSPSAPPSGFPVEGYAVYLLDERMQPVKDGAPGEIVVAGPWLARGYLNRPDLTAERFIPNPLDTARNGRCFRTGDIGRRLPGGSIEVLCRADDQTKIHGFRVEPGEIESALREHSGVREAAVKAVEAAREPRLAAYIVPKPGTAVFPHQLRRFLTQRLPAHKIPSAFVMLESLPLTASGKIDRRALPYPTFVAPREAGAEPAEPPLTPSEIQIARIWEEVLGFGPISRSDHFFELCGDSLSAMIVAARVHSEWAVELNMRDFAGHPTLSELASEVDRLRGTADLDAISPIVPVSPGEPCPLSFAQEAIWNHIRHAPRDANDYVKGHAYRLSGPLNFGALEAAMRWVAQRHDILRTVFPILDGKPVQAVPGSAPEALSFEDLSAHPNPTACAAGILAAESSRPFDLARGPCIRQRLVKIAAAEHWLIHVNHQIVSDRWSWTLYFRELGQVYEALAAGSAPPAMPAGLQYRGYAAWERRELAPGTTLRAKITNWWRQQASGRPRDRRLRLRRWFPSGGTPVADAMARRNLDPALVSSLETLCMREGATYFAIGLAVFAALLTELQRSPSVTIGVYVLNRWRPEFQQVLGNFTSLVPMCLHCDPALPFREWLQTVRETLVNLQAHAHLPIGQFEKELLAGGTQPPEVHAIMAGPPPTLPISFGALRFAAVAEAPRTSMPWGLSIGLKWREEQQPHIVLEYDARLYHPAKARRLFERFHRLLEGSAGDSQRTVAELLERT